MAIATKSYYDVEVELNKSDLANLLGKVSEIRQLHANGAATHFGYISLVGNGLYEVGTLVIDVVDDTITVFHRQTERGLTESRHELSGRVSRGY